LAAAEVAISTIWHQITAFLLLDGGFLIAAARSRAINRALLALVAAQNAAFGVLFLAYGWGRLGSPLVLPQWIFFFAIAGLILLAGLVTAASDRRAQ
jgi:hypothetical protein